uniref:DNA-directed RNA polymerase subunit n=1 Tax=Anthurium amnicola TaxID=1678845 RepID=A0A1D1Z4F6_9ARAE
MESSMAQALRVSNADLVVYVHPSNANRVQQALCRQLSVALFTFNETFNGVLLAYSMALSNKTAKILPGLIPYFCVNVKAQLLLFSPKQDMLLEGKVVKLSKESIYVIVLGFCTAVIASEDIRGEFKYKIKDGLWVFSSIYHKHHVIKPGTMLRFLVKSFDEEILHVSGSLIPPDTGCICWLSKHEIGEDSKVDSNLKMRNKRGREVNMLEQDLGLVNEGDLSLNTCLQNKSRKTI